MSTARTSSTAHLPESHKTWALLSHLGGLALFLGLPLGNLLIPALIWGLKRREMPFVVAHARESFAFQVSMTVYLSLAYALVSVRIGWPFIGGLLAVLALQCIRGGVAASRGRDFRYAGTLWFLRSKA